ncbi:DUF2829 domain-containing protein [Clostridioides difficile]|nr:DUF2829 domain-containing protein [Clostridioides difficile]MDB3596645.1 DUF2829 domain-containing protein [Clostridioides difficile]
MLWNEAFKLMKEGNTIKLPSWGGYWYWDKEKETIMMHTKDGKELDIRETGRVDYTFSNIAQDNWILADKKNTPTLGGKATMGFDEALKYLKKGYKVARTGWNGKGMYVQMDKGGDYEFSEIYPFFVIKNILNSFNTWVLSVSDLLANDWEVIR